MMISDYTKLMLCNTQPVWNKVSVLLLHHNTAAGYKYKTVRVLTMISPDKKYNRTYVL